MGIPVAEIMGCHQPRQQNNDWLFGATLATLALARAPGLNARPHRTTVVATCQGTTDVDRMVAIWAGDGVLPNGTVGKDLHALAGS